MATILVIDSEETVRNVVSKILIKGGYEVTACEDLGEALAFTRTKTPDLILTNVYLRDTTGHAALATLKAVLPDIAVLMVSGLPDEKIIQDWRKQRGFDVFPKPFSAESLLSKVSEMLSTSST